MRSGNERIRLTALVAIVAVLVVRLSYDATSGTLDLRRYAIVNVMIVLGAAAIIALTGARPPAARAPQPQRRARYIVRSRCKDGSHTIHLN